ncbi:hypothetical protein AKJ37_07630 [candidate division MSBL1 archaeon SCGC-AAA259I09]|uniref:Prefoldin subunit beta n=3 Tax=candidate division MSBL1 TaxID=215777 RepID=A0A133UJX2_9EURY|nr:hypothetical protein AKJ37_07630 [candidate division MSBL1 archaeon SCGC-AAA259I09]KXA95096.1 hypothetical protein AKJ36_01555 [candidate division MSBL1 archaeon SCGC-AAA259I07]KXA98290.1 hypothetical protein AKJ40_04850 [candidate division MSBL1 archaeon SCGC-AAA259M10]
MQPSPQDLPPEAQDKIQKLQKQKRKLEQIGEQKNRFKAEDKRLEEGIKALDEADEDKEVFKVVGPVGIKSNREDLKEELSEKKERIKSEIESMENKENEIRESAKENQSKLREMMAGGKGMS